MRTRVALLCVAALLLAACGSRLSDDELRAGQGASASAASDDSATQGPAADPAKFGTMDTPCGPRPAGSPAQQPTTAPAPGVSPSEVRIGVISDKQNAITPVPTIGIEEAVRGFVDYCNSLGGVNGRRLALKTYDSGIVRTDDVTKQACKDDLFALVGDGSVQDQQGVDTRVACGLPEIAAYSATQERASSKDFFAPLPARLDQFNVGPCRYLAGKYPKQVKKAAMIYVDAPASRDRAQSTVKACERGAGFKFVVNRGLAFGEKNFGPVVDEMKSKGVEYFTMIGVVPDTLAILEAMAQQDLHPVVDLPQQYYDDAVLKSPVAQGAYVQSNTVPFSEAGRTPALAAYEKWTQEAGGKRSSLGVQAFSAGLFFATALKSLGDDLSRERLVAALKSVRRWDGGGMTVAGDPTSDTITDCFMYLRIEHGAFVREHPAKGFDCSKGNVLPDQ